MNTTPGRIPAALLALLCFLAAVPASAAQEEPLVLAILEFEAVNEEARQGNKGRMVSEIFTTAAVQSGLQVVERHMIRTVLDEMEFGGDAVSGTMAQKIGVMLGANAVLTGSVSEFMGALRIDARLISVDDGAILLADGAQTRLDLGAITEAVMNLTGKMVAALHGEEPPPDAPAQAAAPVALQPVAVQATSSLPPSKHYAYDPGNLLDGDPASVWVEGAKDNGKGEGVFLQFSHAVTVQRMDVVNGYDRLDAGGDRWQQNGRVKLLRLAFSDGQHRDVGLADTREPQTVDFPPVKTEWVRLTILDTYPGAKWPNDTCLGELSFYGAP